MTAEGLFTVSDWTHIGGPPDIRAGLTLSHLHMVKNFTGQIDGRSLTEFTGAFNDATQTGTYVAMESFEGSLHGLEGTFLFAHMATVVGGTPTHDGHLLVIVPSSGTHELTGIRGGGQLDVDENGTHRITLTYSFEA